MNIDEIAKKCGLEDLSGEMASLVGVTPNRERLIKFAALVAAESTMGWVSVGDRLPKPKLRQVIMLGWFDGHTLFWHHEARIGAVNWKRVPAEDKIIEVEE